MAMPIMIQGTMSNVGKSLLTAALCRIFKQDGYSVAPFKSQNMALNSFVTKNGLEMGRAQVTQAEASCIEPDVSMNPILLKPTNDTGSQVILNGKSIGNMSALEYYKNKKNFIPAILKAYSNLSEKYDIIVIEGAGSPAEINLNDNDIVNMGMAKMARAPVLLIGDIDRGGVFAQIIGTLALLDYKEKNFIKGLVINKFRGDKSIFKSGIDILEKKAKKPVIGVVPYIRCDIDEEDSLTERFKNKNNVGIVDIAVIKLPRISNFTDFNVFDYINGASLRYVDNAIDLRNPDILIIPGTKNTIDDLLWIRKNGIEEKIKRLATENKIIFGICGGYQMLGKSITDKFGIEHKGEFKGLNILPIKTFLEKEKNYTRVTGNFTNIEGALKELKGQYFEGYEIHNGVSEIINDNENMSVIIDTVGNNKKPDGVNIKNIYGTYVHGIFDYTAQTIVSQIMKIKGINNNLDSNFNIKSYKNKQYNLLADTVRSNIDINIIYKILKEGI